MVTTKLLVLTILTFAITSFMSSLIPIIFGELYNSTEELTDEYNLYSDTYVCNDGQSAILDTQIFDDYIYSSFISFDKDGNTVIAIDNYSETYKEYNDLLELRQIVYDNWSNC